MNEIAIEVNDLSKTYPKSKVKALDGVSFQVKTGKVLGLLGPNGAGKTTIVRILTTIIKQDSGSAKIFGLDLASRTHAIKQLIGLAGQYAAVDENLTGFENLTMISRLNHMNKVAAKSKALELLEKFDLIAAKDRTLKTYSGGMRRRLDLAASLVNNPAILFLDEPTTGLDPQSRLMLWDSIQNLVKSGTTVLLTTQYLEEADRLADTIIVIDHGRLIANGTPTDLKKRFGSSVISITLRNAEATDSATRLLSANFPNKLLSEDNTLKVISQDGPKLTLDVLRIIDANNIEIVGLNVSEPSLDDVFLTLTGQTIQEN